MKKSKIQNGGFDRQVRQTYGGQDLGDFEGEKGCLMVLSDF